MSRILGETFMGVVYGIIGAICLFVIGGIMEVANFGCAILTCDCDKPTVFDWSGAGRLLIICIIGGAIIGFFYGVYKVKQESDEEAARRNAANLEEAKRQRIKRANEIKKEALNLEKNCKRNKTLVKPVASITYKASDQMENIMEGLFEMAELQGEIEFLSKDLSKKGSDQL